MCNSVIVLSQNMTVPFLSYNNNNYFYDEHDDLHYFVLDCKKLQKYYYTYYVQFVTCLGIEKSTRE